MRKWVVVLLFMVGALSNPGKEAALGAGPGCLSGECHSALMKLRYPHGPVAAEMSGGKGCEVCHQPTGAKCTSDKGGSFKTKTREICMTCHGPGTATQHYQGELGDKCLGCHNPHGSDTSPQMVREADKK